MEVRSVVTSASAVMSDARMVAMRFQTVKLLRELRCWWVFIACVLKYSFSFARQAFDFAISFEAEVSLTWGRSWGYVRCLFAMARYFPFTDVPIDIYYSFIPKPPASCLPLYQRHHVRLSFTILRAQCIWNDRCGGSTFNTKMGSFEA
ncbi:hypothetical protein DEU56DRAFT_307444 [Suillus clintonianus]|uniref:uncharacterized protein n=1 Tax=Suillus clintonianus TaxID=1904413 RepID=UPI001B87DC6A|nr:uncharacterized protein DEU56DRAFT_307444 [Suillus clintonianus]KAG2155444.1 hypothetical protein DEU56DRAFT_307444 [Suillus clintonianus]